MNLFRVLVFVDLRERLEIVECFLERKREKGSKEKKRTSELYCRRKRA